MKYWKLTIDVLEDLHVGTGMGVGDIDSLQVRDRHGNPVLPASHIKGVWRDVALQWHSLIPEAMPKQKIDIFFGRSGHGQGQLQLTSAYYQQEAQDRTNKAATLLWGSTRIDPSKGVAQENSLRLVEYIPAGSRFVMQIGFPATFQESDEALVFAIIARCQQLGAGRNRGNGKIRWQKEAVSVSSEMLGHPLAFPARLRLVLRNLEPLCLARTGHPGNLISTDYFIRGRSLRGAFVAACLSLQQHELAQQLLDPMLSWGDALPLPPHEASQPLDAYTVLPIPLTIGTPKISAPASVLPWWVFTQPNTVLGARQELDQVSNTGTRPAEKLKRPNEGEFLFGHMGEQQTVWQRYQPTILERLHTAVPNGDNQAEQALFSTEEIAENTRFVTDLLVSTPAQATALQQLLLALSGQWLRVGRGGRPVVVDGMTWLDLPAVAQPNDNGFTLLLTSDLIVRDCFGNFYDRFDAEVLRQVSGCADADIKLEHNFSEGIVLFGFNAATGLPRFAQRAIKAGSVIRVIGKDAQRVAAALGKHLALGECPEEGFGRFLIDQMPLVSKMQDLTCLDSHINHQDQIIDAAATAEALCGEAEVWQKKFERNLNPLSASQLSDFRSRVLAVQGVEELAAVFTLIEEAGNKHGGKAWQSFTSAQDYKNLKDRAAQLASESLLKAQHFLDYFVRWQRGRGYRQQEKCQTSQQELTQ